MPSTTKQQLGGLEHHLSRRRLPRHAERAFLETFRDEHVAITVPVRHSHAVGWREKNPHIVPDNEIFAELRAHERGQPVDSFPVGATVKKGGPDERARP